MLGRKTTDSLIIMKRLPATFGAIAKKHSSNKKMKSNQILIKKHVKRVFKMLLSLSPCAHDQISIIILKKCLILRTYIHKIISHCWSHRMFPRCWKYAFTILAYKKKSNTEPSIFVQLLYNQFW